MILDSRPVIDQLTDTDPMYLDWLDEFHAGETLLDFQTWKQRHR